MKYQLLQISDGIETVLLDTDKEADIRKRYYHHDYVRIRVEGRTLRIFEADAWAAGRRIPKPKDGTTRRVGNGERPVYRLDKEGTIITRYKNLKAATAESGYKSGASVRRACDSGEPTTKGMWYRWADEQP